MIFFRLICAICIAWAISWVLNRPEGAFLAEEAREMLMIGPASGIFVGYLILASRQGMGLINGVLNGFWSGILTVLISGFIYLVYRMSDPLFHGLVDDFRAFLRILYYEADPLFESLKNTRLIGLTVGLTTIIGIATELLQWGMVRFRKEKEEEDPFIG